MILLSSVEKPLREKACDHFVWLVWKISCKSYVLVKYFLLFYFAFVQFILLCFHFSDVTIVFKKEKKKWKPGGTICLRWSDRSKEQRGGIPEMLCFCTLTFVISLCCVGDLTCPIEHQVTFGVSWGEGKRSVTIIIIVLIMR